MGRWAMSPVPSRGVPNASKRAAESTVAHKWADWLCHPCRLQGPQCLRARGIARSGPQKGGLGTSHLPLALLSPRGSPKLQSCKHIQNRATKGRIGYVTLAVWGVPIASKHGNLIGSGSELGGLATAPLRTGGGGGPQRFKAVDSVKTGPQVSGLATSPLALGFPYGSKVRDIASSGPQMGELAMLPMLSWGSPSLQSGGQS